MRRFKKLLKIEAMSANHWGTHIGANGKPKDLQDYDDVKSAAINDYMKLKRNGTSGKKFV